MGADITEFIVNMGGAYGFYCEYGRRLGVYCEYGQGLGGLL